MDWGWDVPEQTPSLLSSGAHSIPGTVHFSRPGLQQDHGSPVETEWPLVQG